LGRVFPRIYLDFSFEIAYNCLRTLLFMNLFANFNALVVGVLTAVSATVSPVLPGYVQQKMETPVPVISQVASQAAQIQADGENYYYIQGTYSYLGQKINYHIIVPKNGGSFNGAISGACEAQLGANYAGGNGGAISGSASGKCNLLFVKYEGNIPFKGNLYPKEKKLVIELEGAHLPAITLNYN